MYQRCAKNTSKQSIDKHMIKFKGKSSMKQYIKNKPIKWGFKVWQLCDSLSGYLYEFDLYTGRNVETSIQKWGLVKVLFYH